LPPIFLLFLVQAELIVDGSTSIADKAVGVFDGVVADPECAVLYGDAIAAKFSSAAEAAASLSVAVSGSASVGSSAGGF
jgi:type IV secretory pathway TrbL component